MHDSERVPVFVLQPPQTQYQPPDRVDLNQAPIRIQVAMKFLHDITDKTRKIASSNDISGLMTEPGNKLTPTETNAQMHAHLLLIDYFKGSVKPDAHEKLILERAKIELDKMKTKEERRTAAIGCPPCRGQRGNRSCLICRGYGVIIARPPTNDEFSAIDQE